MRLSQLFVQTLRETPGDETSIGHQFLQRAGYIRQVSNGVFTLFPLAKRSLQKLENIARQELSHLNGQELSIPSIMPTEIETNASLHPTTEKRSLQVQESPGRNSFLAETSAGYLSDLIEHSIRSHRQLPRFLYQIQPKVLPPTSNQNTLMGTRVITRLECYLLDKEMTSAEQNFQTLTQAFHTILKRSKLPFETISDHPSADQPSGHEFYFIHPGGNQSILTCLSCGYQSNQNSAIMKKPLPEYEELLPLEDVHTPDIKTIGDLATFLNIPTSCTAKAVFMTATLFENGALTEKVVMAIVRGDMELNPSKLAQTINARSMRASTEEEITSIGAVAGFASPVGLENGLIVIDDLIVSSRNLVAGANRSDYHLKNVNFDRDYKAHIISDISLVKVGDPCPDCHQQLEIRYGFKIGSLFSPNADHSSKMNCNFQDEAGLLKPVIISSGWMDLDKILGAVAEVYNDKYGLILPYSLSPYQVHLIVLPSKNSNQPVEIAEKLYQDLLRARIEVLYDDRNESPGVKFNIADLFGIPLRITVAEKGLNEGCVEMKLRSEIEKKSIPLDDIIPTTMHTLLQLERDIAQTVAKK